MSAATRVRFEGRTLHLTRDVGGALCWDGVDVDADAALAVLAGDEPGAAAVLLAGARDADERGLVDSVEGAAEAVRSAWRQRRKLSLSSETNPAVLVVAVRLGDAVTRAKVAENPATPVDVVVRLRSDPVERVRNATLRNPNLPVEDAFTARLPRYRVAALLGHTSDVDLIGEHLDDGRVTVLRELAKNPNAPGDWLVQRVEGDDAIARANACRNPSLPAAFVDGLFEAWWAGDRGAASRLGAVFSARRPGTIREPERFVTEAADRADTHLLWSLIRHPDLDDDLAEFVKDWLAGPVAPIRWQERRT